MFVFLVEKRRLGKSLVENMSVEKLSLLGTCRLGKCLVEKLSFGKMSG